MLGWHCTPPRVCSVFQDPPALATLAPPLLHPARSDKRKKVKGKKPGVGADKTERKTEKNEEKRSRRLERAAQVSQGGQAQLCLHSCSSGRVDCAVTG